MSNYLPTANEYVTLSTLREEDGAIEAVGFLNMAQRGMIEIRGDGQTPFFRPFLSLKNADGAYDCNVLCDVSWEREHYWIPKMTARAGNVSVQTTYLTPVGERGFCVRMTLCSDADVSLRFGGCGRWAHSLHIVNEEKEIEGTKYCYNSHWNRLFLFEMRAGYPLFSFAPMADTPLQYTFKNENGAVDYSMYLDCDLKRGEEKTLTFFWGFGFEEVASATSAQEMLRRTYEWEYDKTAQWLEKRIYQMPTEKLSQIYNTNLFFCIFFSTGRTIDSEELVCVTSRSPRYYVSAAYWDRDTLLWSFPAILDADAKTAKEALFYIFGRQGRNFGVHSRYIDGTVLEPGFELDELMAPIIALSNYVRVTDDREVLGEAVIRKGIESILEKLAAVRHESIHLYESFLQPSDDMQVYPYLTYDNMLVWLALNRLSKLYPDQYGALAQEAALVKQAVYVHCVAEKEDGKRYFAWSSDLKGNHEIYDEPPGSLQLLPYYGFCDSSDEIWRNTVKIIRSSDYKFSFSDQPIAEIGCAHAPYPWLLSLCNSLLSGHEAQAWRELEIVKLDNGIACEGMDPIDGSSRTGQAFATCAGFLCHSMRVTDQICPAKAK